MCVVLPKHFYISSIPATIFTFVSLCSVFVFVFGSYIKHGATDICMSFICSRNFMFCPAYVM